MTAAAHRPASDESDRAHPPWFGLALGIVGVLVVLVIAGHGADAQGFAPVRKMPFGIGGSEGAASPPGNALVAWLLAKQSAFYMEINAAVRRAKTDGTAVFGLIGISFLYGIFHAAGPGHGKAVIASYMVANEQALKRGVLIAFLAAALQGCIAIAVIGVIALLLHGTAQQMTAAGGVIELVSYAAIALFGLALVIRKGRALLACFARTPATLSAASVARTAAPHIHDAECGHLHMPDAARLSRPLPARELAATVFAAGLRPCTGAILVLVYALSQGIFYAGIGAVAAMSFGTAVTTSGLAALAVFAKLAALRFASGASRSGEIAVRGLEFAAALLVTLLGTGLLFGFLASQGSA